MLSDHRFVAYEQGTADESRTHAHRVTTHGNENQQNSSKDKKTNKTIRSAAFIFIYRM